MEHYLFLTGRLAQPGLNKVLDGMRTQEGDAPFTWETRDLGLQVAALMTADMVKRRMQPPVAADRIILPGRCRGDVAMLTEHLGVPVERGPEEMKDLPQHFKRAALAVDLSEQRVRIFAEVVDAPRLSVEQIVARATTLRGEGADVIDLGCLPETRFDHLPEAVRTLKSEGFAVSVDSLSSDELLRGGQAGADALLSLTVDTLWIAKEVASTPVLIPKMPLDVASLHAAIDGFRAQFGAERAFYADPILDPIPFGFAQSVARYHALRQAYPDIAIMMGVGNLTELTEADTSGINALLFGIAEELNVSAVLTTQVSPHARRAVAEADAARRLMRAAGRLQTVPKSLSGVLATVHARRPHTDSSEEIAATATQVKDPNFRVQVNDDGIHVYNRDGLRVARDAFALWPQLGLESDAAHAFYMGVELAKAQLALELGKRYVQDQPLDWGVAVPKRADDLVAQCAPGTTMTHKKPVDSR